MQQTHTHKVVTARISQKSYSLVEGDRTNVKIPRPSHNAFHKLQYLFGSNYILISCTWNIIFLLTRDCPSMDYYSKLKLKDSIEVLFFHYLTLAILTHRAEKMLYGKTWLFSLTTLPDNISDWQVLWSSHLSNQLKQPFQIFHTSFSRVAIFFPNYWLNGIFLFCFCSLLGFCFVDCLCLFYVCLFFVFLFF